MGRCWPRLGRRAGEIKLSGWVAPRRICALRRLLADESQQLGLAFVKSECPAKRYEYAVLVTDLPHDVCALAQLYRDRADSENTFDELKNQWGWGGYTSKNLKRSRFTDMTVALVYNWWPLFVRLANSDARQEAITSRPFLLSGVARKTSHAGQQHLNITSMHGKGEHARVILTRVSQTLHEWKMIAEQLNSMSVWQSVCQFIATAVTGSNWLALPQIVFLPMRGSR